MEVTCAGCGIEFEGKRSTAKYCGPTCRKRGQRRGGPVVAVDQGDELEPVPAAVGLVESYREALAEADRLNTPLGQHVLTLAQKMTGAFETGSGIAALSKQLDAVFDKAMAGIKRGDAVDEFSARLKAKQEQAGRVG